MLGGSTPFLLSLFRDLIQFKEMRMGAKLTKGGL